MIDSMYTDSVDCLNYHSDAIINAFLKSYTTCFRDNVSLEGHRVSCYGFP